MNTRSVITYLRFAFSVIASVFLFTLFFSAGFLIISMIEQGTNVQLKGMGGEMLKNGERSGSAVASVAQPGPAIPNMGKHVSDMQLNLDTPKKVQAGLDGS